MYIFTVRKGSLGQGSIFTPVCHSVHRVGDGWYPSIHCRWYPSMPCSRRVCYPSMHCSRGDVCYPSISCSWGVPAPWVGVCSRGVCSGEWVSAWSGGVYCHGGLLPEVPGGEPPGRLLLRAVRILLECILVLSVISSSLFH